MKFTKQQLIDCLDNSSNELQLVSETIVGTSRWSIQYRMIFQSNITKDADCVCPELKFYETFYSCGATEVQDERPFEYSPDEIECDEVKLVEKTVLVYEKI